jgi:HPt (histidine-containing phosphotransfer) domain-containing protein
MVSPDKIQALVNKPHPGELETPILDHQALLAAVEQDLDLLRQLVEIFLAEAPGLFGQLRVGIREQRAEAAERAAQTLKSAAGNLGGRRTAQAARVVELEARANHLDQTQTLLPGLEAELAQFCQALSELLTEPAP